MTDGRMKTHPSKEGVRLTTLGVVPLFALTSLAGISTSCSDEPEIGVLRPKGVFTPAALNFGEVPVDMQSVLPVRMDNVGNYTFTIDSVTVPQGFSMRGAKGLLEGREIVPGEGFDFEVVFLPMEAGARQEQLIIADGDVQAILDLTGAGVIRQVPVLAVTPVSVDFGAVALEDTARATVTIQNTGTAPGIIERATLGSTMMDVSATDTFGIGTQLPVTVDPGQSASIDLVFRPTLEAQISDVINLVAKDHNPLDVAVTGRGIVPLGDVLCSPSRLDFGQVQRGTTKVMSVTCEARGGPARLIGARVTNQAMFVLPSPPVTSDLQAGDTVQIDVEFRPDGARAEIEGILAVEYNGGMGPGTVEVNLVGEVIPPPPTETAMSLNLQWTSNGTDVDLHFVRPGGVLFERAGDCYFGNKNPDWGTAGDTTDNPFLDVDDVDGYGPEEINLSAAPAARYEAYAHYFTDNFRGATEAIVEVYIAGQLAATRRRPNLSCGDAWHVGTIDWDGTNGTFIAVDGIQDESDEGVCF